MTKETLQALKDSIRHLEWLSSVDLSDAWKRMGSRNCALCRLFIPEHCINCPVYKSRCGKQYCFGTPYVAAREARCNDDDAAALEEAVFLKSLLPKQNETDSQSVV